MSDIRARKATTPWHGAATAGVPQVPLIVGEKLLERCALCILSFRSGLYTYRTMFADYFYSLCFAFHALWICTKANSKSLTLLNVKSVVFDHKIMMNSFLKKKIQNNLFSRASEGKRNKPCKPQNLHHYKIISLEKMCLLGDYFCKSCYQIER